MHFLLFAYYIQEISRTFGFFAWCKIRFYSSLQVFGLLYIILVLHVLSVSFKTNTYKIIMNNRYFN